MEALWAVDQPRGNLNLRCILRDTLAALKQLPAACSRFRKTRPSPVQPTLSQLELAMRANLSPTDAYNMVPGRAARMVKHMSGRGFFDTCRGLRMTDDISRLSVPLLA